jgi:F-type H+-transporting ATPase subunit b
VLKLDWNILFTVINLIVLLFILKKFLFSRVLEIIEKREAMIKETISNAEKREADANRAMFHYTERLEQAEDEARQIIEKSKDEALMHYNQTIEEAQLQAQQILSNAQNELKLQEEKIISETKDELAALAADMAKKLVSTTSSYDQFVSDMNGKNNDN